MSERHVCTGCGEPAHHQCMCCREWRCVRHASVLLVSPGCTQVWCAETGVYGPVIGAQCAKKRNPAGHKCETPFSHDCSGTVRRVRVQNPNDAGYGEPRYTCLSWLQPPQVGDWRWIEVGDKVDATLTLTLTVPKPACFGGLTAGECCKHECPWFSHALAGEVYENTCLEARDVRRGDAPPTVGVPTASAATILKRKSLLTVDMKLPPFNLHWTYCENAPPRKLVEQTVAILDGDECGGVPRTPFLTTHLCWTSRQQRAWEHHEQVSKRTPGNLMIRTVDGCGDDDADVPTGPDLYGSVVLRLPEKKGEKTTWPYRCRVCGGWMRTKPYNEK